MKDKEFDRLLSQSLKEHGHEYLHGADGPLERGPVPVHQFRDDFLSDIVVSKPAKKKNTIKYVRFISTVAAAFVVALAAVIIVPQLLNRKNDVVSPGTQMPWESSSVKNAAADKAADLNSTKNDELGKPLNDSSRLPDQSAQSGNKLSDIAQSSHDTDNMTEESYKERSTEEYTAAESTPVRTSEEPYEQSGYEEEHSQEISYEESAYEEKPSEIPQDNDPSLGDDMPVHTDDPAETVITLPEDISFTMIYNGSAAAITKNELNALTAALSEIISADNYTDVPYPEAPVICDISIDSRTASGRITVNEEPFESMSIKLYPSKLFVTLTDGGKSMTFCVDSTNESFMNFRAELTAISG